LTGKPNVPAVDPVTVIRPDRSLLRVDMRELWGHRDFLWVLVWRELKIRYKQTVIGVAWVLFQPLVMMAVYSFFFGYLARLPSGQMPYPLFVLSGIVPWILISRSISDASATLAENRSLLTRLYFPRLILPLSSVVVSLADFGVAMLLLLGAMLISGVMPGIELLFLPLFILELIVLAVSLAILAAALNGIYRDFGYIVPLFLQVWMFSSPIIYASGLLPAGYRPLYAVNPLVGILEGFRWSLGGGPWPNMLTDQIACVGITAILLCAAIGYFRRVEKSLVDRL
jgi:lipopolysaccharide transport system permease protein